MSIIWPPQRVKMASTPSFLSALATRLPPEIFGLASAAGAASSFNFSTAPAMVTLLRAFRRTFHFRDGMERGIGRARGKLPPRKSHRFIYRLAPCAANLAAIRVPMGPGDVASAVCPTGDIAAAVEFARRARI